MKIKTNLRAGAGKSTSVDSSSTTSTSTVDTSGQKQNGKTVYVPPVYTGRCIGG